MKKPRRTPQEAEAYRRATLTNYVKASWPELPFDLDDEARAAFAVGPFQRWPKKDLISGEEKYQIDVRNALHIVLDHYPESGHRHRMIGEINDGILHTWRNTEKPAAVSLHWYEELDCYTIARWPIVNATRYGFHAVQVNDGAVIPVEEILEWPEVPAKLRGGYERQVQLIGVTQGGWRRARAA